jgi:mRNA-degrading endonuclease HigB of HigAB toxin-antitoxin module
LLSGCEAKATPVATKADYDWASIKLKPFDIGGNKFRIIARVAYGPWYRVMIKFVGTHAEYDRVDARTV